MRAAFWIVVWGAVLSGAAEAQQTASDKTKAKPAGSAREVAQMVEAGGLKWHTDYYAAYRTAQSQGKMLVINFTPASEAYGSAQAGAEQTIATNARLQEQLNQTVLARVSTDATIDVNGQQQRLLGFGTFSDMQGGPGFAVIDLQHRGTPYYGQTVSVLPFSTSKYYSWSPSYLSVVLGLPGGTLTQRTMMFAVRVHPESPQSTWGEANPVLLDGAMQQASYQASVGQQGHQNFETRFHTLSAGAGGAVSEVCAESWPNQNLLDSCLDCVASWRHSPGHWRGVSGQHRAFGYDIRRGRNGIWYGTGIFAD